jgi:predicted PurR-regulated permease PerM
MAEPIPAVTSSSTAATSSPPNQDDAAHSIRVRPLAVMFCWLVALALFLWFFKTISTVMLGLLAAAILTSTLKPLIRYVPLPKGLAALLLVFFTVFTALSLVYLFSAPLAEPIKQKLEQWPQVQRETDALLADWNKRLGLKDDKALTVTGLGSQLAAFLVGEGSERIFSGTAEAVLSLLVSLALVIFGSIFFLAEPPDWVINGALRIFPPRLRPRASAFLEDLAPRYRRWVLGTVTGMAVVFTASVIGFNLLGIKVALPLAILAGLAEVVPTVGPAICALLMSLITLATESGAKTLGLLGVYGVIQALEAYLVLPLIMREAVKIHPAVTLFTIVLWGKIFGVPGLILAIPINVTLWCAIEHFHIRRIEAGQPPAPEASATLTP